MESSQKEKECLGLKDLGADLGLFGDAGREEALAPLGPYDVADFKRPAKKYNQWRPYEHQ